VNKVFTVLGNLWAVPELRRKLLITCLLLIVFRILAHVPLPGVNPGALRELIAGNSFLGLFNLFSGSSLQNFSIASLGLGPYITASVIFQLLAMAIPQIEEMRKEQAGVDKINQWTRLVTVPIAAVQGLAFYFILSKQAGVLPSLSTLEMALFLLTLTAGTIILMWLGELITEYGLGNGISLVITAGILSSLPVLIGQGSSLLTPENAFSFIFFIALAVAVIAAIVAVNEGERRIPIHYAKRVQTGGKFSNASSHLPLKVNQAGVMPIIFALSLVAIPGFVGQYLSRLPGTTFKLVASWMNVNFTPQQLAYNVFYFILVVGFTYFYTAVTFNPNKIAEDIRKYGGFIPGIRPGRPTENYLNWVLARITLSGAVFLGIIAILPSVMQGFIAEAPSLAIGGTSLLIVISVVLETVKQAESLLVMRDYDSFLS